MSGRHRPRRGRHEARAVPPRLRHRHRRPPSGPPVWPVWPVATVAVAVGVLAAGSPAIETTLPAAVGAPAPGATPFASRPLTAPIEQRSPVPRTADRRLLLPATVMLAPPAEPLGHVPPRNQRAYVAAARTCGLPWRVLAAIDHVAGDGRHGPLLDGAQGVTFLDSDDGRLDGDATYDRTVGPLGFLPWTWERWAPGADPHDLDTAARVAAQYLCATSPDLETALRRYGRTDAFVAAVRRSSR